MKRLFILILLFIGLLHPVIVTAQSNTDKVRQFERLLREWKSAGYSTGSEKYTQLKAMVSEGCKMSERVAKAYIDEQNATTIDIRVNSWLQYIKEKKISISLRDLSEKTGDDGRRIVYCWIKYSEPGKPDKEDFVGFKFDGGKIFYIGNDDMERANRLKSDSENNVVENKSAAPFTITSCTVSNVDYDNNVLPFDAAHTQYLKPEIRYTCKTSGSYDIYVKFYDANGSLRTGSDSPSGYSQVNTGKSLSSGSGSVKLSGWGGKDSGHWRAGNYRYEFYYNGNLLYTHRFSVPEWAASDGSKPYAVFSNGILTFYYGKNKPAGAYGMRTTKDNGWSVVQEQIIKVVFDQSFKNYRPTNCAFWFSDCKNLIEIVSIENLNTSKVETMDRMFEHCHSLKILDVSGFNTENVSNMFGMFSECEQLTKLDVSRFNTAKVVNMSCMFYDCKQLTSLDVSRFETAKVTNMSHLFRLCEGLTSLDVSGFHTENVTQMVCMFSNCKSLTSLNLSSFHTKNVTDIRWMFFYCPNLKSIYVGDGWNTSKVTESDNMFQYSTNLVGGRGTRYDSYKTNYVYAHIDGGTSNPGYFTRK
jgi:surface protein